MQEKICLTTFIYGRKYQEYIPVLLFSVRTAYPEYDVILFVHGTVDPDIRGLLKRWNLLERVRIIEHSFDDCPKMSAVKACSLRWILWTPDFLQYDYLYYIDADMFYIREVPMLHEQHQQHLATLKVPFSNVIREKKVRSRSPRDILRRLKLAGFANFMPFLAANARNVRRLTGLHFVKVGEYFEALNENRLAELKKAIYDNSYIKSNYLSDNEAFLYDMLSQRFDLSRVPVIQGSVACLDFDNPARPEFRPHHGIHFGIFRLPADDILSDASQMRILKSRPYRFYFERFGEMAGKDDWKRFSASLPPDVQALLSRLYAVINALSK